MLNKILEYILGPIINGGINFLVNLPVMLFVVYLISEFQKNKNEKWLKINLFLKKLGKITMVFLFCFSFFLKMMFRKK